MPKWADYLISGVQFNAQHTHINHLRIAVDNGDSVGQSSEHSRQDIVAAINNGTTFLTIYRNSQGTWDKGKQVYVIRLNGVDYLKTVNDNKLVDNLDNLPEF
ncbi:DUF3892 domain-containing protein [Paraburkholderia sp. RL17-347-BIC-D]|uniref:DUF3892 domain-containing protein n=1 Tax=Paraburkholderia sp. RL17-347-BIC-D TaxID=3031632 RepID=UPI0038BB7347